MALRLQRTNVVGTVSNDTEKFDDISTHGLNSDGLIFKLAVFYDQFSIIGISIFYDRSAGKLKCLHLGTDRGRANKRMFHLKSGEHINHVSGKVSHVVTRLFLRTDRGNTLEVGGQEGTNFDLNIPSGFVVHGFQGGVSTRILSLGAIVKPTPPPPVTGMSLLVGFVQEVARPFIEESQKPKKKEKPQRPASTASTQPQSHKSQAVPSSTVPSHRLSP
jgi:hypothetical protein